MKGRRIREKMKGETKEKREKRRKGVRRGVEGEKGWRGKKFNEYQ